MADNLVNLDLPDVQEKIQSLELENENLRRDRNFWLITFVIMMTIWSIIFSSVVFTKSLC